ncbi:MAG: PAS domain-containing protein [Gemmatimonadetes bacterium]|nr:PAS domain-containing protein [Gemmatimonadota bacterium]
MSTWWKRLGHDRRVLVLTILAGLPGMAVALGFIWLEPLTAKVQWTVTVVLLGSWMGLTVAVRDQVIHPLGTLANMLAALREGDFSIRARVEDASDALSLAYLEVNNLEEVLREQRLGAVEATETLRKVLEEIDVAVLAFDPEGTLRLVNRAGERLLNQPAERLIGKKATELRLEDTLRGVAPRTVEVSLPGGTGRWELRRSVVRQEGYPLQLVALSDLSRALREEERQAWKRIIRVLSHEINNSLAPIKSITGSLQDLLGHGELPLELDEDVQRGLQVISTRAEALGRFMASYARLARLPQPQLGPVDVPKLVQRVADLETRLPVRVAGEGDLIIQADADQLEQALINLVRNAVDATLESGEGGSVSLRWLTRDAKLHVLVEDDGPGLGDSGNLFVPFYTTKQGGSGIGLVLSRQIAEGHGGSLTLEGRGKLKGARATLVLPTDLEPWNGAGETAERPA